jgi:hypothetical protein
VAKVEEDVRMVIDTCQYLADEHELEKPMKLSWKRQTGEKINIKKANVWVNCRRTIVPGGICILDSNYDIDNIEIIAGKGSPRNKRREIDNIEWLVKNYYGTKKNWFKVKGIAVAIIDGRSVKVEIHWFENAEVGTVCRRIVKLL